MNIIFDIGKVLIDFNYEDFVHSLFDPEAAEAVIDATWHNPEWTELDRGVLSVEQVLQRFIAKAPEYEREIRIAFAKIGSCPKLKPTTVPMIKQLKAEGHKVFFLSNYFEYLIHAAPWALEFRQYMDGGVFSCFEHEVKPDAAIFRILCDRYALKKEDSVFIDDSLPNIKGSETFGIRAIHYTGQTPEELRRQIFIK